MRKIENYSNRTSGIRHLIKQVMDKQSAWTCSCGYVISKEDTELSGYPSGNGVIHVHCPDCGKVIGAIH